MTVDLWNVHTLLRLQEADLYQSVRTYSHHLKAHLCPNVYCLKNIPHKQKEILKM